MKDPTDSSTADMHPGPKKRGPKPTGKALTPAERKRRQRRADSNRVLGIDGQSDGKTVTVTGLIEAIARAAHYGHPDLVLLHAQQLADRIRERKTEQATHVTVTDPGTPENP